jgi:hypothetical protein
MNPFSAIIAKGYGIPRLEPEAAAAEDAIVGQKA